MRFSRNLPDGDIEAIRVEGEERDAERRAGQEGVRYLKETIVPTREALLTIPEGTARSGGLAVVSRDEKRIAVAVETAKNEETKNILKSLANEGYLIDLFITTKTRLEGAWERYSSVKSAAERADTSAKVELEENMIEEIKSKVKDRGSVVGFFEKIDPQTATSTLLGYILGAALVLRASDIHIERKEEKNALLRLRIDGDLRDIWNLKERQSDLLVGRVKLLAGLKLNVRDSAQDGRFTIGTSQGPVEVRASIVPAEFGEAVVMRVLDPAAIAMKLEDLGIRGDDAAIIEKELKRPNGMILVTGPTGSGKTTTLYAFLKKLHTQRIKIITIEDPIEYHIEGVEQTQTDEKNNYTFVTGLRSILRQDPDVILVGEIRDTETAKVSIDAALTGHLVLSTLHTNNAAGAIPRLTDLEVRPSTIGPALRLVIAQRLVKKLCTSCRKKAEVDKNLRAKIEKFIEGLPKRVSRESMKQGSYEAVGCGKCDEGFSGRIAIMELLTVDEKIDSLIRKKAAEKEFEKEAVDGQGMVLIQEDGVIKALQGITTLEEVERATGSVEW